MNTAHCEAGTYHTLKEKPAATAIFAAARWWLRGTMNRAISSRNEVKFLPLVMILYRWFYDTFKHRTTNSPTPYREKKTLYHCSRNYSIQCSTFVKCQLHYKTINSFYRIVTNWQRFLLKFLPIFKGISCMKNMCIDV